MSKPATEKETRPKRKNRSGLNFKSIEYFPKDEVPQPTRSSTPFKELLQKIPDDQAIYITDKQVSLGTAGNALRKLLAEPQFKNYEVTRRTVDGEIRLYIIHHAK